MSEGMRRLLDRRQENGSVFLTLDQGETLELASGSVPEAVPEVGGSISSPLLAEIRLAAECKKAARRVFAILDRRLLSVERLRRKLADEDFSASAVEAVLDQLANKGIYSDRTYAAAYCRDTLSGKLVGRRYLETKLWQRQVERRIAKEVVAENLDPETEKLLAGKAACWKWERMGGRTDRKAEEKVARYLVGRGFPTGLAWQAVRQNKPTLQTGENEF